MTTLGLHVTMPTVPGYAPTPDTSPDVSTDAAESDSTDFSFHNVLSIFNPLQHIPVVSTLYRHMTGDTIGPLERVAGDTLYGGWMGLASSVANLAFEKETGKDFGDSVLAFVETGDLPTFVASNNPSDAAAKSTAAAADGAASSQSTESDKTYGIAALAAREAGHKPLAVAANPTTVATAKSGAAAAQAPSSPHPVAPNNNSVAVAVAANVTRKPAPNQNAVAMRLPAQLSPNASNEDSAVAALQSSMLSAHLSPEIGQRALDAYRKSVGTASIPADLAPAI